MTYVEPEPVNTDLSQRAVVDSNSLEWLPSPLPGVWRRPLERDGGEVARATTIVRFAPNSHFSTHTHGGGEEFFVLEGTFSDEEGDFPAGFYVRNPPGSSHAPHSEDGCTILVKLCQMAPEGEPHVVIDTNKTAWQPTSNKGRAVKELFAASDRPERVTLERLAPGTSVGPYECAGGEEIFVLEGGFSDEHGSYAAGTWVRNPPGFVHTIKSEEGCVLWIKRGHLAQN